MLGISPRCLGLVMLVFHFSRLVFFYFFLSTETRSYVEISSLIWTIPPLCHTKELSIQLIFSHDETLNAVIKIETIMIHGP